MVSTLSLNLLNLMRKLLGKLWPDYRIDIDYLRASNIICQKNLLLNYGTLRNISKNIRLQEYGFSIHSQHDEDGIILLIFGIIGTTNKKCIEICAGDGIECNTANLILNHRWYGLLIDGNSQNIVRARSFYSRRKETRYWPPKIVQAWITKDNVNDVVGDSGFNGEIDLLSLDIDGNDYCILESLSIINPRVIVLEYNHILGWEDSLTTPYDPNFKAVFTEYGSDYAGASIMAFVKLCRNKGYRLIGSNTIGTNAFFLRNDIESDLLPEIDSKTLFEHPRVQFGITHRLPGIINRPWNSV
jgi:hypothetical protein